MLLRISGLAEAARILAGQESTCMLTLYSDKGCNGNIYFNKPGTCNANIDGLARWSYALTCAGN